MEKKELLNEEEYLKNKNNLKNIGKILLIVGGVIIAFSILLIIIGVIIFGNSAIGSIDIGFENDTAIKSVAGGALGGIGLFAIGGFGLAFGVFLASIGGIVMFIAHRREITAFTVQQTMPIAQEGIEKMTPTVADAAGSISKSVSKGITEGINEANKNK